ncbi:MAG: flagellar biosynthesis anti-sigma factor FlgM [Pseudomonadota bacterium]
MSDIKITERMGYEANKYVDKAESTQAADVEKAAVQKVEDAVRGDVVNISSTSRDAQLVAKLAAEAPDIRSEKVESIKEKVDNNTYNIDHAKVADKMVGSILNEIV